MTAYLLRLRWGFRYTEVDGEVYVPHLDGTYVRLFGTRIDAERFAHATPPLPRNPFEYCVNDDPIPWSVDIDELCRRALEIDPTPISESERFLPDFWSAWLELHGENLNLVERLRLCRHLGVPPIPHRAESARTTGFQYNHQQYPFVRNAFDQRFCWLNEHGFTFHWHWRDDKMFAVVFSMLSVPYPETDHWYHWWEENAATWSDDLRQFLYWLRDPFPYKILEVELEMPS